MKNWLWAGLAFFSICLGVLVVEVGVWVGNKTQVSSQHLQWEKEEKTVLERAAAEQKVAEERAATEAKVEAERQQRFQEETNRQSAIAEARARGEEEAAQRTYERKRLASEIGSQLLSEADLCGLSRLDLGTLRNSLFAVHGYHFKPRKWDRIFRAQPWYADQGKTGNQVWNEMSWIEQQNVRTIRDYEAKLGYTAPPYAKDYQQ